MLLSFLKKSKSLIGIRDKDCVVESEIEEATAATEDDDACLNQEELAKRMEELKEMVYEHIRTIKDPEKPATLEDLNVVYEDGVKVQSLNGKEVFVITVLFNPTVPHCSLATLIGLCIRVKLQRQLLENFKLDIYIKQGTHNTEQEINKQINDKERIAAAMENPSLKSLVEDCIKDQD